MLASLIRRLRGSRPAAVVPPARPTGADEAPLLVDGNTRTFWSRGAQASETLVEATAHRRAPSVGDRVAALVREREHCAEPAQRRRTVTGPAFSEALFVELVREGRYERAFALLAPDCRSRWGSAERFGAEQRASRARPVEVDVRRVRRLDGWVDPDSGIAYGAAAELEVAYTLRAGHRRVVVERVVHLVDVEGAWRSLCYPAAQVGAGSACVA